MTASIRVMRTWGPAWRRWIDLRWARGRIGVRASLGLNSFSLGVAVLLPDSGDNAALVIGLGFAVVRVEVWS